MNILHVFNPVLSGGIATPLVALMLAACNSSGNSSVTESADGQLTDSIAGGEIQDLSTEAPPEVAPAITPITAPIVPAEVTPVVSLSWVAPVEREDGAPISMAEIAGYRIYYGTSKGGYKEQMHINDSSIMHATLSGLATGTYYMVVTTLDVDGRESTYSQEVKQTVSAGF